jgi:hypothetical protein
MLKFRREIIVHEMYRKSNFLARVALRGLQELPSSIIPQFNTAVVIHFDTEYTNFAICITIKTVTKLIAVPTTESHLQRLFIDACSCNRSKFVIYLVTRSIRNSVGPCVGGAVMTVDRIYSGWLIGDWLVGWVINSL